MFTPSKPTGADPFDVTLLNTPQPQATSTVQRKSTLESKFLDNDINAEVRKYTMARKADATQKTEQSSLGILDSISSFLAEVSEVGDMEKKDENKADLEREFARKLLQKCSDFENTSTIYDTNKENNANIQNLSGGVNPSIVIGQSQSMYSNQINSLRDTLVEPSINKTGTVVFEPNEITARSSELSRSSEKSSSKHSSKTANAISFDTTTAEYMAQFNNEEFRPASEMASQMLADEISWQQNYSYALPTTAAAEKEYLNLSCFSGIIGELDLSVESCAGRKMSVDEFFRRKCGTIGELSDDEIQRPSFGLSVSSPKKKTELVPLVDATILTEVSSIASSIPKNMTQPMIPKVTKDTEEQSIMSLSSIAQALQDIDNGTPRRLVDQLIMAKKKRRTVEENDDKAARDTYTLLPSNRKSMPVTPSTTMEKLENDIFMNISAKLSLDSRIINDTANMKQKIPRMLSFDSNAGSKRSESFIAACKDFKREVSVENVTPTYTQDFSTLVEDRQLSLASNKTDRHLSPRESKLHTTPKQDRSSKFTKVQKIEKKENIKEENISYKDKTNSIVLDNSNLQNQFQLNRDVVIGKSTDELCSCIVGMSRETEIELTNNSDRWVTCSLAVNDVQGDKQNIKLTLPKDMILIKPNAGQRVKIIVKVVKMCKPIIAVLNITVSDMVTRSKWVMKHIICFKPEEFDVHISSLSQEGKLDFQCVIENTVVVLPIAIKNRNNIALPIMLSIMQDEPMLFNIENSTEMKHFTLKPQETTTLKIHCNGILSKNAEMQQRRTHRLEGRLKILMENNVDGVIIIKEIPLIVQVGVCKLEVVNTDIPMIVTNKQSKPLTIINLGNIAVLVAATFVQESEPTKAAQNFFVQPEKVVLQPNETGCFFVTYKPLSLDNPKKFVKIKLSAGGNAYYYSIIGEATAEERDHLRCETPQYMSSVSSPTSPHSVASNSRTGTSGRNSPSSSISGSTVAGDKIPIRSTHAALMWNSVKPGKSETKEFTIRNTSNNKIKIQAVIWNNDNCFRFLRDRQASSASIVLVLQRTESRTLSVVFSPHRVGAAAGKMYFKHYEPKREDSEPRPSKAIYLYGYGGYGKIEISEAFKDMSGKMWLSLGTLNSGGSLNAKIKLQNTGDLISYAKIKLTPKAVYPTTISSWIINPTELLLHPKETQWVTLEFRPRKEDLTLLQRSDVSHVGTLTIIHGDEPTRWRIRRLYNKMKESGELNGSENEAFRSIVHPICKSFPGEQMIQDLHSIRETVQNLGELCRGVRQHEIMLTMEVCADETLSFFPDNADDSQMFYSLCSDNSHLYEGCGESFLPSETMDMHDTFHRVDDDHFTVSPSVVVLNPPTKTEAFVTIRSSCIVAQPFETSLSDKEYLSVVPAEGMIPTRKGFQLKIQCKRRMDHNLNAILEIYTQNNKQDVQIRIVLK